MINPQLLEYIRAQRAAGLSKDAITQALAAGGWNSQDANEAFMAIEGVKTPPPPPPAAPGPAAPRTITPPPTTPAMQQPMGGQMQPMGGQMGTTPPAAVQPRPMMAASELSTAPGGVKKRRKWPWILLIILLVIIGLGVAAFMFGAPLILQSLGHSNSVAEDAIRQENLSSLRADLEIYASEHNTYPSSLDQLSTSGVPGPVPADPVTSQPYTYNPSSDLLSYTLCAQLDSSPTPYCVQPPEPLSQPATTTATTTKH